MSYLWNDPDQAEAHDPRDGCLLGLTVGLLLVPALWLFVLLFWAAVGG